MNHASVFMIVALHNKPFDAWDELRRAERTLGAGSFGANAIFIGTMRGFADTHAVQAMTIEHYPQMTHKVIENICSKAIKEHALCEALIVHRVGDIVPGETIVVVGAWSVHRAAAFAACRNMMEALKSEAPFWKKEKGDDKSRWVEYNTPAQHV